MNERYDYIICGAGASGCVLARRLSDNPDVSVLVLEAGDSDEMESIQSPALWPQNIGSPQDWQFKSEPNAGLMNRQLLLSMGKVLGGGSSINALQWARGYSGDWDYYAEVSGDLGWGSKAVKAIYENVEKRTGPCLEGEGSPASPAVGIEAAIEYPGQIPVLVEAADGIGLPTFENPNETMLDGDGGGAPMETIVRDGKRQSMYRSYLHPVKGRSNLTIATRTTVTHLVIEADRARAVQVRDEDGMRLMYANQEIVLCLGAVNTPKLLMQSGIGQEEQLRRFDISVKQSLPAVGENYQDHPLLFGCAWRFQQQGLTPNISRAVVQWKTDPSLSVPNIQINQSNGGTLKQEMADLGLAANQWWSLAPALIQPKSRGRLELTGREPDAPVRIFGNYLGEPEDLRALLDAIELCRDLAASPALAGRIGPELLPGPSCKDVSTFVRSRVGTFWHQSCTAKMGAADDSVVDANLRVYGIDGLRIADASVLPRITAGNTMAPCVIIGERASRLIAETWSMKAGEN